jgi:hypothetical protein
MIGFLCGFLPAQQSSLGFSDSPQTWSMKPQDPTCQGLPSPLCSGLGGSSRCGVPSFSCLLQPCLSTLSCSSPYLGLCLWACFLFCLLLGWVGHVSDMAHAHHTCQESRGFADWSLSSALLGLTMAKRDVPRAQGPPTGFCCLSPSSAVWQLVLKTCGHLIIPALRCGNLSFCQALDRR